ncbi:hypothetical protein [Microvirga lotononidis]|uniref:Uncharacterized protein n=1 Tax=Microvirga lotononidis TaxID=864069 RepID=I4YTW9_9HYPH|nr:hypothetical protein [Microvirga lotononidis]EIM27411.1 hypothetical protein MicloDRAFT_00039760 [Microvirga lotononidis]WQO28425.1 hypothetical protein U0023_04865 [Microvirga lotononidis]
MPSRDEALAITLSIAAALMAVLLAVIAGAGIGPQPATEGGPPGGPACAEWTDGCVVCRRTPDGLACSTPGIACVPAAPRCLRPTGVPI